MRCRTRLPELLAPAGDMEALFAAVLGGADAVYIGGKSFGARAFAKNFELEEIREAVAYCHTHSVKLYVTVNTLITDKEMPSLLEYAGELYLAGVDALICADLGAISLIKENYPALPIHASTQMSVHNVSGANEAYKLGCERVVPARELSAENIRTLVEKSPAEIEIFLHGALCVCHSGQCLFSSLVGGRSGNRGECAQPCRLPYNNGKYPLSLKDLSLAGHIREIISLGVSSLKIEGRMKSSDYVYRVTKIYRRLLDEGRDANDKEIDELQRIFSRDGFTDGYFTGKTERAMTGVRTERDKERSRGEAKREFLPERVAARAELVLRLGEPSRLTLIVGERRVTVYGDIPSEAINAPLTEAGVKARIAKMGNTYLTLSEGDITLSLDEGINLSPSALNKLRRDAVSSLIMPNRPLPDEVKPYTYLAKEVEPYRTIEIFSRELYSSLSADNSDILSKFDIVFLPLDAAGHLEKMTNGVSIPPVIFDTEWGVAREMLALAKEKGAKYALISNIGAISLARELSLIPIGNFRLNITNGRARDTYRELGVDSQILSVELTPSMIRDIGGGAVTFGKIPLMITERCFMKELFGCDRCGVGELVDRTGARFPMMREFSHRNTIFNSTYTYMGDKGDELVKNKITHSHFILSNESCREAVRLLRAYFRAERPDMPIRRIGRR